MVLKNLNELISMFADHGVQKKLFVCPGFRFFSFKDSERGKISFSVISGNNEYEMKIGLSHFYLLNSKI